MSVTRIAIVTTHPIQYYAPLFRLLAAEADIELKVFYTWSQSAQGAKYDHDFGKMIEWDIPLLEKYPYEFVLNTAKDPGVHHFLGIQNPDLQNKIEAWKPDILLMIGWNYKSHLACMRYFKGKIPVWFKGDSTLLDEKPGIKTILRRIFLRWVYRHVDYALYVGKNNRDYFKIHGIPEGHLQWVPHAIDNSRFDMDEQYNEPARQWRMELGIDDHDLVVLFAGKLEPKKDPALILRLASAISDPLLKFIIVGNGQLQDQLKSDAAKDKRIIFLDFQNQQRMPVVYRLGDIFVLPSRGPNETWGLAVNEAMACKRPVIVSNRCGCAVDLVEQNVTGWVFDPFDNSEAEIKDILTAMLKNRSALQFMGNQAREKVKQYSYRVAIEKMRQLSKQQQA